MVKPINTDGIGWMEPFEGGDGWYWGTDYTSGDLYEAEELYRDGHRISKNRLVLVRFPEGRLLEPVKAEKGQYFGRPYYEDGRIYILLADFPAGEVRVIAFEPESLRTDEIAAVSLTETGSLYNLMLHGRPLMLTRQAENRFQIIWPEKAVFPIDPRETFCFREGGRLYFSRWYEDPDYREEAVVRKSPTGEIVEETPGSLFTTPDGQNWLLK